MLNIKIPTWATLFKIPVGTPVQGLAALNQALGTSLSVGDPNPVWYDLQDLDLGGGPLTRGENLEDLAEVIPITNASFITVQHAQLAVVVGGEIEGMEVWFELDPLDMTDEVPATFSNRTYPNPENLEGDQLVHTWETWGRNGNSHAPVQIGEKWYKSNADANNLGQPMPASLWVFSGLTIKTLKEYKTIIESQEI